MPLFRWKKTRRYEVSSRNSYVVCVHLLDTSLIECTLTADSCGLECLENIAQRIELNDIAYFGLRYVNKKLQFRWVELDKPLKKQLDRSAHSALLYFGVMFYIPDAQSIQDDMTRYQYYLQLKSDIIDGKLSCSPERAVLLAAYSVQAELGDFDFERHTVENLKDVVLLPRNMTVEDRPLLELTQDIISHHQTLLSWSAATAEVEYILEAQQLKGYGMDYYTAKDHSGQELLVGAYYRGIFVNVVNSQKPMDLYKWTEITSLSCNKKQFTISTPLKDKPVHFIMDDPDVAKYISRLFMLQLNFFTGRLTTTPDQEQRTGSRTSNRLEEPHTSQGSMRRDPSPHTPGPAPGSGTPSSHYDPSNVHEDLGISVLNTPSAIATSTDKSLYYSNGNIYPVAQGEGSQSPASSGVGQQLPQAGQQTSPVLVQGAGTVNYSSSTYLNTTPAPPSYRHTPDYETVMRQRIEQMAQAQQPRSHHQPAISTAGITQDSQLVYLSNILNNQVYAHPETLAYSQPEIHHLHHGQPQPAHYGHNCRPGVASPRTVGSHPAHYQQGADLSAGPSPGFSTDSNSSPRQYYPLRPVDRTSSLIIYPTYASPDVYHKSGFNPSSQYSTSDHMLNEVAYNYRPPPPYPRSSNSTPDLASQTIRSTLSSSPDLISRRHMQSTGLMVQSFLDQSVENLAMDTQKLSISQHNAAVSKQNLDDASSIQSEALSHHQLLQHGSSIPDVAHSALLSQEHGTVPAPHASQTSPQSHITLQSAHTSPQSHVTLQSASPELLTTLKNRPAPPPVHYIKAQPVPLSSHPAPENPASFTVAGHQAADYRDTIAFDNPAFRENLPMYLRDQQEAEVPSQLTLGHPPAAAAAVSSGVVLRNKKACSPGSKPITDTAHDKEDDNDAKRLSMGALKMAAMNGLSLSSASVLDEDATESPTEEVHRIPKDERRRQLESKLQAGQVFAEFEKVHKKRMKCDTTAASQPLNKDRNRFKDVLPYDDNRIKLTPTKENPIGYINASSVQIRLGQEDLRYITAQGPLPNTVQDFWQLIWEHEVDVIAMLTKVQEHGKVKCHQYWPHQVGPKHKVQHSQYQVVMRFSNNAGPYTTSGLLVKHLPSNRERLVWHLQYTDWPDHGCPHDVQGFLAFLDEVEAVKRQTQAEKAASRRVPVLVHCSAGVGRSGVLILTEVIKVCLEHNLGVDVPGILADLRDQRMYMVQTVSQYGFVYNALVEYLKGSRLI